MATLGPKGYLRELLKAFAKSRGAVPGVVGVALGLAGVLSGHVPAMWMGFYFLMLLGLVVALAGYGAAMSLRKQAWAAGLNAATDEELRWRLAKLQEDLDFAEDKERLIQSRAQLRAIEKRRIVTIDVKGKRDLIETVFLLEALDSPVVTFLFTFATDRKYDDFDPRRDLEVEGAEPVKVNKYSIGRVCTEYIVENRLDRPILKDDPRMIRVLHRADLVDPADDWAGLDIIEDTDVAFLEIRFPTEWRPLENTVYRYTEQREQKTYVSEHAEIRFDKPTQRWIIAIQLHKPDRFVSHCVRWKAERRDVGSEELTKRNALRELAPRRTEHRED
jgi:hypothetical protein